MKIAPVPAGAAGRLNEAVGPRGSRVVGQQTLLLFFRASCFDLTVVIPGTEEPSRDVWVPAKVYPLPHGAPHLCSWWDHPPDPPCPLSPAGESDPSPALLAEQHSGSLTARTRAPGLFQPRGLHTARQVCTSAAGSARRPPGLRASGVHVPAPALPLHFSREGSANLRAPANLAPQERVTSGCERGPGAPPSDSPSPRKASRRPRPRPQCSILPQLQAPHTRSGISPCPGAQPSGTLCAPRRPALLPVPPGPRDRHRHMTML